jgi:hypothetical protein
LDNLYGIQKVDKLILNEELNERYKEYGLCKECKQGWCQSCNSKHFQQNFENWTSGNRDIDEFIQRTLKMMVKH